jgi:NOL1/NOP2/fmu family ribosome biogenesis protein
MEHRGEVFFLPEAYFSFAMSLASVLHVLSIGTHAGKIIRNELIPAHALALSIDLKLGDFIQLEMNDEQALAYLKKESFSVESKQQGLALCLHKGVACGWAKIISGKLKNSYPVNLRIMHPQPHVVSLV